MLENILYTLDQNILIVGIVILLFKMLFASSDGRFSLKVAFTSAAFSAFFSTLFYNKVMFPTYFDASAKSAAYYLLTVIFYLFSLKLTSRWAVFQKDFNINLFCFFSLLALSGLHLMMKTNHLGIIAALSFVLILTQYGLFYISKESENLYHTGRNYLILACVIFILFLMAILLVGFQNLNLPNVAGTLILLSGGQQAFVATGILCFLLFMLGAAPFQFWKSDAIAPTQLPVATYFSLVPVLPLWAVLFKLNNVLIPAFQNGISNLYFVFGTLSVVFAVIGANASRFFTKIFAFTSLYHTGVALFLISSKTSDIEGIVMLYMALYLLFILGIYICLYGIKENGENINNIAFVSGYAKSKPFGAAAFTFFISILMALPPLAGFLVQLMALEMAVTHLATVYIILFGLLGLSPVYFKILQTLYFQPKENHFDKIDMVLYIYLALIIGVCLLLIFKSSWFAAQLYLLS